MVGSPFYLDGNSRFSYRTEVAFSGGQTGVVNADDEFLAVNIESGSSYDYLDGAYIKTGSVSDQDVSIEYVTGSVHINNPDITGNPFDGNYLVVWEAVNPGTPGQSDIFAQRMGNMDNQSAIFLPLVLR
jgi:hypothetical protein